jgi:hypothetical protein
MVRILGLALQNCAAPQLGNIQSPCGTMNVFTISDGMVSAVTSPSIFSMSYFI